MKKIISVMAFLSLFSMPITNCVETFEEKKSLITDVIPKTLWSNKERSRYLLKEKFSNGDVNYYILCDTPYYKNSILGFKPITGNCKVISFGVYYVLMKGKFFIPYKQGYFTESNITFKDDSVNVNKIHNQLNIIQIALINPKTKESFDISVDAKKLKNILSLFLKKFEEKENLPIDENSIFHLQAVIINYDNNSMYLIYEINGLQHYYCWNLLNKKIMNLFINSINDESVRKNYLLTFNLKDLVNKNEDLVDKNIGNYKINEKKLTNKMDYSIRSDSTTKSISNTGV